MCDHDTSALRLWRCSKVDRDAVRLPARMRNRLRPRPRGAHHWGADPTDGLARRSLAHDLPFVRAGKPPALGSRGNPSWILRGRGDAAHLCSVAHGAGRKIPRSEAKARLLHRYRKTDLTRTALGGRVLCDRPELLWEEHQDVYKPIEPVVAALEHAGVATRVASLVPMVTVKR